MLPISIVWKNSQALVVEHLIIVLCRWVITNKPSYLRGKKNQRSNVICINLIERITGDTISHIRNSRSPSR